MPRSSRLKYSRFIIGAAMVMAAVPVLAAPVTMAQPEAGKLIGHRVEDIEGHRIGDIQAIHINRGGKVEDVIVGVGGFLGVGERDVSIKWKDLKISGDGAKVTTELTKQKLKDMPPYTFPKAEYRRTVFETPLPPAP